MEEEDTRLCLGEGNTDMGRLQGATIVGPIPAHGCYIAELLEEEVTYEL